MKYKDIYSVHMYMHTYMHIHGKLHKVARMGFMPFVILPLCLPSPRVLSPRACITAASSSIHGVA